MNGEVNRAVAQRVKAGWLRRNSAVIPRPALAGLRGASFETIVPARYQGEIIYDLRSIIGKSTGSHLPDKSGFNGYLLNY